MRLAVTGDSILERRLLSRTDPELAPLFDLIRGADLGFTNLEVLPNDFVGDPAQESGGSHFGAPSWVVDELSEAGFHLFATATNHSLDYGVAGLHEAMKQLARRGVTYAGIGRNLEESRRPAYHTHPAGTVALISCCSTFAKGQQASAQRPDMSGRPGLSPVRVDTVYEVTEAQLGTVREMADQLGLAKQFEQRIHMGFGFAPDDPAVLPLGDMMFRAAQKPAIRMTAKAADLDGIARWVREARSGADLVLVSLHAHEQAETKEDPAEFIRPFAHRMIEEGADLVVGHGPHLLRGIEIHRGKPIFYSLGNFIGQNELVSRLPSDSYDRFRAEASLTPLMVYRQRTAGDTRGFPSDARYWETVVPICTFSGRELAGIELYPVSLGLGEAAHRRGRPRLAEAAHGRQILERLAALSRPFGTTFAIEDARATIRPG